MNQEADTHQTPNLLAPSSWTSQLQTCEKYISVVSKPLKYNILLAAQTDCDRVMKENADDL